MSDAVIDKPRATASLLSKAFWLIRYRQGAFWSVARTYASFHLAAKLRKLPGFRLKGVTLADNVRIQNNRSLMAEAPLARVEIGRDSVIYRGSHLGAYGRGRITIGESSVLGDLKVFSRYGVTIGKRFLPSWNVYIQDFDPHPVDPDLRARQVSDMTSQFRPWLSGTGREPGDAALSPSDWSFPGEEVVIGDDVWIGANCTLLKGVRIGDGCVVAAGSVVPRGEYPPRSLIAGNPARVVKSIGSAT